MMYTMQHDLIRVHMNICVSVHGRLAAATSASLSMFVHVDQS